MNSIYQSDFEDDQHASKRKCTWKSDELSKSHKIAIVDHAAKRPAHSSYIDAYEKEEKKAHFAQFLSMSAYARHKKLVSDYLKYYGGKMEDFQRSSVNDRTDFDVIKENHRFIWGDDEEAISWGKRLAKKYYDKLFKEYCICDLSRYKDNKVAMRWRVENEVVDGKGQFVCGARKCPVKDQLSSWEVNFGYLEEGEKKQALVKLRLCPACSDKLNYTRRHTKAEKKKVKKKKKKSKHRNPPLTFPERQFSSEESSCDHEELISKEEDLPAKHLDSKHAVADDVWKQPAKLEVDKTREEEFDEYLEDLFL